MHKLIVAFKCQLKRYAQGLQNDQERYELRSPMSILAFAHMIQDRLIGHSQLLLQTATTTTSQLGTSHPDGTVDTNPQMRIQAV